MSQPVTAFADEFGNNSFDFRSQGTHFIVATVITRQTKIEQLRRSIDEIRRKHNFQKGEIKSSSVGPNHSRRKRILRDIAKLDISIYAVVVDKTRLYGEGFRYKKSFYKFLNGLLYKELFRTFPDIELHVDEHGGNDFMREFRQYVEKNHSRTLFSGANFIISRSDQSECIQIADFVAGSLGYIFDGLKRSEHSEDYMRILSPKISSIKEFPNKILPDDLKGSAVDESFDERIASASLLRIEDFLSRVTGTDQQRIDQIGFLKLLLWLQRAQPSNTYFSTREIVAHLNQNRAESIQQEYFRTKIVGALRDRGVLIASGRKGYKIPTSARDLDTFVNHGKRIILPMLNRIKLAREAIKLATENQLDLLDKIDYAELRAILK